MHRYFALALSALFCLVPAHALATDYSDIWWSPPENGWGMNIAQSDNFIFATFFVYDVHGLPTWYTGQLTNDGNGNYTGPLYSTTGNYFGAPYNPALVHIGQVGVATFSPLTAQTAVLTYNVGPVNVAKNVQRLTLTAIALGGTYSGGQAGQYSGGGCSFPGAYKDHFDVQVTQPGDGTATFQFTYQDSGLSCTLSGTLQQTGMLYSIPNASYSCSDGLNTSASMFEIKATSLGIEARFVAPSSSGGCREDAAFSAVLD